MILVAENKIYIPLNDEKVEAYGSLFAYENIINYLHNRHSGCPHFLTWKQ